MMERLTFMNGDSCWCVDNNNCFEEQSEYYCGPAISRLAHYEDLEEQGRILPCKMGDEFWTVYCGKVQKVKVSMMTQKADGTLKVRFSVFNGWGSSINDSMDVIGKTVFLTREEAEQMLDVMKS